MKQPFFRILIVLVVVALAIQFIPGDRTNPVTDPDLELRDSVRDLLARSCFDCHSQQTSWPWYSRLAPVSWLLSHHVKEGREKLNFSLWQQYTPETRQHLANEAVEEVSRGKMPLPMYLFLHRSAKVSEADRTRLTTWARSLQSTLSGDDHNEDRQESRTTRE